jgi:site-specific recombinase XerD
MRRAETTDHGLRLRALVVVLWRAGLRIGEAMALTEPDLDRAAARSSRAKARAASAAKLGWTAGASTSSGPGRPPPPANHLRRASAKAGVRRRFAPHQLRHAHAVEMAREGVPLNVIQRQVGHVNLGVTSVNLDGIDTAEIIVTVHNRRSPMISASAGLMI